MFPRFPDHDPSLTSANGVGHMIKDRHIERFLVSLGGLLLGHRDMRTKGQDPPKLGSRFPDLGCRYGVQLMTQISAC